MMLSRPRFRSSARLRRVATAAAVTGLALSGLAACGPKNGSADASAGGSSFAGKTLQITVPYGPGGGYDQWARVIAPYMQKYLGVAKVMVVNTPGGGGLIGTGQIYHAKPDGLTIGDTNAGGDVFDQIDGSSGFNLDMTKVNWLGRPDDDPHLIATHADGPTDFDGLRSGGTVSALATGKGSSDYNAAVIVYNAFKVPFKMVAAFSGSSDEKAAFLSGEGTTASLSSSDIAAISDKSHSVLLVSARSFGKLPAVPTVIQQAQQDGLDARTVQALQALSGVMDLGHAFFAPPGVPADKLAALRTAFTKSMNDPDFKKAAAKAGLYQGYASPQFLSQSVTKALGQKSLFTDLLKAG